MNPLTKVKLINELNEREAALGVKETVSWHSEYKDSAWIFIGGFPYELTEGDIICVFSQYGEIANVNLVRDKKTGKSKGFCFICYEDQRSTILAVDNFNGIKIKGRTIRVDHVLNYRPPKDNEDIDDVTKRLREEGCAPKMPEPSSSESEVEEEYAVAVKKPKKDKKDKKKKKKEKKEKKRAEKEERQRESQAPPVGPARVKQEKEDVGYDKYSQQRAPEDRQIRGERPDGQEDEGVRLRHGDRRDGGDKEWQKPKEEDRWRDGAGPSQSWESKRASREERENRDGERGEERLRERERQRDRTRDREREWDNNDRNRERERERDSHRERDGNREKESDRERERHREKGRDRSRERGMDRSRDGQERDRYTKHRETVRESEHRRK